MTMTSRKKSKTGAELMAELESNPTFLARRAEREEALRRKREEMRQAQAPLLQALTEVGHEVKSVWDLPSTRHYPEAVPVLLEHLRRPYPDAIRDGIARALAVPEARPEWKVLTELYREEHGRRTKDGLAVAIAEIATDDVIRDVIDLSKDRKNGTSRLLLLSALEHSTDPRSRRALMELGADPELQKEIQIILRRKKRSRR
jgi:hypothetical protein